MNQQSRRGKQADTEQEVVGYRCSECSAEYNHEIIARVHMSRSSDPDHEGLNGMTPEADILAVDSDGEVIRTVRSHPADINTQQLQASDFPDRFEEREKRALLIAAYSYDQQSYRELEDKINGVLEQEGHDIFSYDQLKRLLKGFYQPQNHDQADQPDPEIRAVDTRFRDLTPRQQAILIGLLNTDLQKQTLARSVVGVSKSYPTSVEQNRNKLRTSMEIRLRDGESIEEILAEKLTRKSLEKLADFAESIVEDESADLAGITSVEVFWDKLNVDWEKVMRFHDLETQQGTPSMGDPSQADGVMTATPDLSVTQDGTTEPTDEGGDTASSEVTQASTDTTQDVDDAIEQAKETAAAESSSTGDMESVSEESSPDPAESGPQELSPNPATSKTGQASELSATPSDGDERDSQEESQPTATQQESQPTATQQESEPSSFQEQSQPSSKQESRPDTDFTTLRSNVRFAHRTLESEVEMDNDGAKRAMAIVDRISEMLEGHQSSDSISKSELESIHRNLQFMLNTLESEVEMNNDGAARTLALVEQLNEEFERYL